jgi:hypothetical protein
MADSRRQPRPQAAQLTPRSSSRHDTTASSARNRAERRDDCGDRRLGRPPSWATGWSIPKCLAVKARLPLS